METTLPDWLAPDEQEQLTDPALTTPAPEAPAVQAEPIVEEPKKRGRPAKTVEPTPAQESTEEPGMNLEQALTEKAKEVESEDNFWEDVWALTGDELPVEFNGIDPNSPEGAKLVLETYSEKKVSDFEEQLKSNYPKEYQALIMRSEGLDPSSLYKQESLDYSTVKIVDNEENEGVQKQVIRADLEAQGLSTKRIEALIKNIYDSGDLYEESKESLTRLKDIQKEELVKYEQEIAQKEQIKKETLDSFSKVITENISKGQLGNFVISDKDKQPFYNYLAKHVQYSNGEFVMAVPLTKEPEELMKQLQTEFFRYKQGNLRDIIVKQAVTENTKRLKKSIKESSGIERGSQTKASDVSWKEIMGMS